MQSYRPPLDTLTSREEQILALIAEGKTNAEIAEALGITFLTARNHVASILAKIGVATREEAADWWWYRPDTPAAPRRWRRWARALFALPALGLPVKVAAGAAGVAAVGAAAVTGVLLVGDFRDDPDATLAVAREQAALYEARLQGLTEQLFLASPRYPDQTQDEVRAIVTRVTACFEEQGAGIVGPAEGAPGTWNFTAFVADETALHTMHDACLSLDNAQPTDARPAWDTITLAAYLVVPDETIDEAFAQEFGRSGGFSRIGLFQRALLEDGVVTIDEHATAAEAFFGCVREHGGSVYMSRFDPASHSPTFEYSGSLDADVCDLRYYREVSTYWQVFMSPDWIYGALMDEGRRADLTEIFVVADPSAALSEVSDTIAGLGACLAAQGPIVAGPTSPGHPESRVLSFFAGGADEAAAMLSSCDGASRAHVFEVLPISPASPADVELPPPSPFVQIGLHARHSTLDDGIVTEDEAEQALGLYRSCLSQTGFTVDGLAIDPALADPNAGTAHDGPGGPERGEELRRICALQRLSGTWEIWQAQQAAAP